MDKVSNIRRIFRTVWAGVVFLGGVAFCLFIAYSLYAILAYSEDMVAISGDIVALFIIQTLILIILPLLLMVILVMIENAKNESFNNYWGEVKIFLVMVVVAVNWIVALSAQARAFKIGAHEETNVLILLNFMFIPSFIVVLDFIFHAMDFVLIIAMIKKNGDEMKQTPGARANAVKLIIVLLVTIGISIAYVYLQNKYSFFFELEYYIFNLNTAYVMIIYATIMFLNQLLMIHYNARIRRDMLWVGN